MPTSHVVVHRELVGMWTQSQGVVFLLFHVEPVRDEVGVEDVAFEEEGVIGLQRLDGAAKRIGHARNIGEFFGRKFVEVLIERIARIDAVLDSVEAGEKQSGKGEVGIRGRVRCAKFDAFGFRIGRVCRNANSGGTVARGVSEIHRRFKAGHESLVAVCRWIR